MPENKHIEYNQQVTAELEKEVVAFLNSNEGGIIYIGIVYLEARFGITSEKLRESFG